MSAPATAVAWIGGRWGTPEQLQIPLADRGLQLADGRRLFAKTNRLALKPVLAAEAEGGVDGVGTHIRIAGGAPRPQLISIEIHWPDWAGGLR